MKRERRSHRAMKARCYYEKHPEYHNYGGRGIKVCARWLGKNGYKNFLEDMGPSPDKTTLDRIDSNKGYYKENCRWATWKVQSRNRRNNVKLTYKGQTLTVTDWAEKLGIRRSTIYMRVRSGKYSIEEILSVDKLR